MSILGILLIVICIGVLFWAVNALSAAFGIPAQIVVVIQVILVVLCLIWVLGAVGVGPGLGMRLS